MTVRSLVSGEHSRKQMLRVVKFVGNDKERYADLIRLLLGKEEKLAQRAAWPVAHIAERFPELILPHYKRCLKQLSKPCHNAIRRNILDAFSLAKIPLKHESELLETCFRCLNDPDEFIAVKALSITILGRLVKKYPELMGELKSSIRRQWEESSPGFRARVRKILG